MKFFGEPNLTVRDTKTGKHFKFNEKGEFKTDDESLIKRLKAHFKYEEKPSKRR